MPRTLTQEDIAGFRERLCDTAARLFVEQGPEAVTMRALAAELGCSPMTPYRYFRDKDAILIAVRADGFDRFAELLEAAYVQPGDARTKANSVGAAYARFAFDRPHAYRLMFETPETNPEAHPDLARTIARARETMRIYVTNMIAEGVIEGDVDLVSHMFWAAQHGAVMLALAGFLPEPTNFGRVCAEAFNAMWRGLAPQKSA